MAVTPPAKNRAAWEKLIRQLSKELQIEQGLPVDAVRSIYRDLMDVYQRGAQANLDAQSIRNNMTAVLRTIEEEAHPGIRSVRAGRSTNQAMLEQTPRETLADQIKKWRAGNKTETVGQAISKMGVGLSEEELAQIRQALPYIKEQAGKVQDPTWAAGIDHPIPAMPNELPGNEYRPGGWQDPTGVGPMRDPTTGETRLVRTMRGGGDLGWGASPTHEAEMDALRVGEATFKDLFAQAKNLDPSDNEGMAQLMEEIDSVIAKQLYNPPGPPGTPAPEIGQPQERYLQKRRQAKQAQARYAELEDIASRLRPEQQDVARKLIQVQKQLAYPKSPKHYGFLKYRQQELLDQLGSIPGVTSERRLTVIRNMANLQVSPEQYQQALEDAPFHERVRGYNSGVDVQEVVKSKAGIREPHDMSEWKRALVEMRKNGELPRGFEKTGAYRQMWHARSPEQVAAAIKNSVNGDELRQALQWRLEGGRLGKGEYVLMKLRQATRKSGAHPALWEMMNALQAGDREGVMAAKATLEAAGDPGISLLLKNLRQPAEKALQLLRNVPKI